MKTVWLDTDIGSDIDDALALAYLLAQPECELLGISTVTEVDNGRAKLASALCKVAGKNIPIYPGAFAPLLAPPRQTEVHQAIALEKWAHDTDFSQGQAVLALRDAIRQNPGEVTLLTIGPLTNIALLFALDPEIPALLKEIVLMCGAYRMYGWSNGVEWNALLDPHAAAMVYRAPVRRHISYGLDVTTQVQLPREECEARLSQSRLGRCVFDMAQEWFGRYSHITFHDPLTAACVFEPEICKTESGLVEIELESPRLGGFTHWQPGEGPHEVAFGVDAPRFIETYFSQIKDS
jgi:purine nucleosidase